MIARLRTQPKPSQPIISLTDVMRDSALLGEPFASPSFWPWFAVAKLLDGERLDRREATLFRRCTRRSALPKGPVRRLLLLVGRRGGKDRFLSAVAVHRAALARDWRKYLSAGEQAVVTLLGADKQQASILRRYCEGPLRAPLLAAEVVRTAGDTIEFRNGSALEIATNDARLVRGRSAIAVLGSECCHWRTDETAASSDEEVVAAAEPSMAMTPDGGLLILGSSVYRRRGYMYRRWRELSGNDKATDICWLAPSATMNPKLPEGVVTKALADDAARARAEYLSEWRTDIENFIAPEAVEACVPEGVRERTPESDIVYRAFVDPSGGVSDSFTLAIGHAQGKAVILDCLRERRPPFNPDDVCEEFSQLLKRYGVATITGDRYAGEWPRERFRARGIDYEPCEFTKSDLYREALPVLNSATVDLLDDSRLVSQLTSLERRTSRAGRDLIDHPPNAHDDLANAACGVIAACKRPAYDSSYAWIDGSRSAADQDDANAEWRRQRLMAYVLSGGKIVP